MIKFGWCLDGKHEDCRKEVRVAGSTAKRCSCTCHNPRFKRRRPK